MGIAKSIMGLSVYKNYHPDTDIFIKHLSEKLNADFTLNRFNKEYKLVGNKKTNTSFGKQNIYDLTITFDEYKVGNKLVELPTYEISVPIKYIYEDCLYFSFYPNHALDITFLTFENLWISFIEVLRFKSKYSNRLTDITRYQMLRNEYCNLLRKIDINKIFIFATARYAIEYMDDVEEYNCITFEDIIQVAKEKDKLLIFDFETILKANNITSLDHQFLIKSDLDILLLDSFD